MNPNPGQAQPLIESCWYSLIIILRPKHKRKIRMRVQHPMKFRIGQYAVRIHPGRANPFRAPPIIGVNQIMPDPGSRRPTRIIPAQIRPPTPLANSPVGSIVSIVERHVGTIGATATPPRYQRFFRSHARVERPHFYGAAWIRSRHFGRSHRTRVKIKPPRQRHSLHPGHRGHSRRPRSHEITRDGSCIGPRRQRPEWK